MSFLTIMEQKATEKDITVCSNCGTPDIFFSLINKCNECGNPLPDKPKQKKLQFSIEILIEFIQQFDNRMPEESKKIFLQLCKGIVHKLKASNTVDNSNLIKLQYLCKHIPDLGNTSFGIVNIKQGSIALDEKAADLMTVAKTLSGTLLCIKFINEYSVPNEFILDTTEKKPVQDSQPKSNPTQSQNSKSGCLGVMALVIFSSAVIIYVISIS